MSPGRNPSGLYVEPISEEQNHRSTSNDRAAKQDRNQDQIDGLEQQEEELRDSRDNLLGSRFELKTRRTAFRELRRKEGVEVGIVVDHVRRLLLEIGREIPQYLENAFNQLLSLRDQLGIVEDEYEQLEEAYNMQEWEYTEKEVAFIENIMGDGPSSRALSAAEERNNEMENLTRYAFGIEEAKEGSNLEPPRTPQVNRSVSADAFITHSQPYIGSPHIPPSVWPHVPSLPHQSPQLQLPRDDYPPRQYGEKPLVHAFQNWPEAEKSMHTWSMAVNPSRESVERTTIGTLPGRLGTKRHIDKWSLDVVACSNFEKSHLKNWVPQDGLDDEHWWQLIKNHWDSDSADSYFPDADLDDQSATSHEVVSAPTTVSRASVFRDTVPHNYVEVSTPVQKPLDNRLSPTTIPTIMEPDHLEDKPSTDLKHAHGIEERVDTPNMSVQSDNSRRNSVREKQVKESPNTGPLIGEDFQQLPMQRINRPIDKLEDGGSGKDTTHNAPSPQKNTAQEGDDITLAKVATKRRKQTIRLEPDSVEQMSLDHSHISSKCYREVMRGPLPAIRPPKNGNEVATRRKPSSPLLSPQGLEGRSFKPSSRMRSYSMSMDTRLRNGHSPIRSRYRHAKSDCGLV
ncbi:hypothetical protein CC78DRAFT_541339 [Lojkania enalia]|uniref:Uncharacterized protein n=1 Tax=Lojkania enalia TaxID=147567 RepID=A0A9P4KH99_9PLEO|nr:hypothetical protein CC78DRAFT_541339 [Didymosphaeria enalia]